MDVKRIQFAKLAAGLTLVFLSAWLLAALILIPFYALERLI